MQKTRESNTQREELSKTQQTLYGLWARIKKIMQNASVQSNCVQTQ